MGGSYDARPARRAIRGMIGGEVGVWLALSIACSPPVEPLPDVKEDPAPSAWTVTSAVPDVEVLAGANAGAAPVTGLQIAWIADGAPGLWDPIAGAVALDPATPAPVAAERTHDGELVVIGDGRLAVLDTAGVLVESPLEGALPGAPDRLVGHRGDLWLAVDGGLWRWHAGRLTELRVDGAPIGGDFAPGARVAGRRAVWVALPDQVVALDESTGEALEQWAIAADSIAVDASGDLWATTGGSVLRRRATGAVDGPELAADAWYVRGSPYADTVWVETAGPTYALAGEVATEIEREGALPAGWTVDELGRLFLRTADDVARLSLGRPLGIAGVLPGQVVADPAGFTVVAPEAPAELAASLVWCAPGAACDVGDTAERTPIPLMDGAGALDPDALGSGDWEIEAVATWADGTTSTRRVPLELVSAVPTWTADIEPLFERRCAACHAAGSNATALDTRELWVEWIDQILERSVYPETSELEPMPFGDGDGLPQAERDAIAEWAAAGFP